MTEKCAQCEEMKRKGIAVQFKQKNTTCDVCGKKVKKVLYLHHTGADLCSIKCENLFWLRIMYD